jgi:hypothetical protein
LDLDYAAQLLDQVTAEARLLNPEGGFQRLRNQLLNDLGSVSGLVLPAQMKLVFRGLAQLGNLTVGNYLRAGGLHGLEALAIEREIAQAAQHAGCEPGDIRALLLSLVDPTGPSKTGRTQGEFLGLLQPALRDAAKLDLALNSMRDADLIRAGLSTDRADTIWQLDHDYLCLSLLSIDRRARRWSLFLTEALQRFSNARGLLATWRALFLPGVQLRLAYERVRGRLTYGSARGLALLSTLRLVLHPVVIVLVAALLSWRSYVANREQREMFDSLGIEAHVTDQEFKALWRLSRASPQTKRAILELELQDIGVGRFIRRSDLILTAVRGLNPSSASWVRAALDSHCRPGSIGNGTRWESCRALLSSLSPQEVPLELLSKLIAAQVQAPNDENRLPWLLTLASVTRYDSTQLQKTALTHIRKIPDLKTKAIFAGGLCGLGSKLSPEVADQLLNEVISVARREAMRLRELKGGVMFESLFDPTLGSVQCLKSRVTARGLQAALRSFGNINDYPASDPLLVQFVYSSLRLELPATRPGLQTTQKPPGAPLSITSLQELEHQAQLAETSEEYYSHYPSWLGLCSRLADKDVPAASRLLLSFVERHPGKGLFFHMACLREMKGHLSSAIRHRAIEAFLAGARPLREPPCQEVADFAGREEVGALVEILKWPTCAGKDRQTLAKRVGDLVGQTFVVVDGLNASHVDFTALAHWAEKAGLDPRQPPKLPLSAR